jgi:Ca2+-binding EF-hand superfamily protein
MTTAVANERLRKRFARWDTDGSGDLQRSDLDREAQNIIQAFGASAATPQGRAVTNAFDGLFTYLAGEAGVGKSGSLTEDQFVQVTEKLIYKDGEAAFNRVLRPVIEGIVGLCDRNADGMINAGEFANWMSALGMPKADAKDAFRKVDKNNNGELSIEELLGAVRDFHFGKLDVELLG